MIKFEISWGNESLLVELGDGEHEVGRASENSVKITAPRVSKRHAMLRIDGEQVFVRDLGSTNGTEVDGSSVGSTEVKLAHDGVVDFAGARMHRAGVKPVSRATTATQFLRDEQVSRIASYNMDQGYSDAARNRIMDVSSELFELLASDQSASKVAEAACHFVSKCISADRVVLLEDDGEATSIEPRARWIQNERDRDAPLQLSSSIVSQVVSGRDSLLVANALEDQHFSGQESIMALNLRSAMAAPLFDNQRVRGMLYADTTTPGVHYNKDDLQVLTATANAVAVKLRNIRLERELNTAARIQQAMLPHDLDVPEGYELEAHQMMCRSVGGDLYHVLPRANGNILIALGDVSGKGMSAALAMGAATVLIGMLAELEGELHKLAFLLHRQLFRSLTEEQFITLFLGEFDPATGKLHYVNCGHEPPLILRADGRIDALDSTGLAVAMIEDLILESADATIEHGDLMFIFSDGIPEATTNGERFLGLDPVKQVLSEHGQETLPEIREKIIGCIEDFLQGDTMSDDVTLMLLRRR